MWPDPAVHVTAYDPLEVGFVSTCTEMATPVQAMAETLRGLLGVPCNIDELLSLRYADGNGGSGDDGDEAECAVSMIAASADLRMELCGDIAAVCSDQLQPVTNLDSTDSSKVVISPAFPLLIFNIRNNMIDDVLHANNEAREIVQCR